MIFVPLLEWGQGCNRFAADLMKTLVSVKMLSPVGPAVVRYILQF